LFQYPGVAGDGRARNFHGFTLIEVLVVVAIIALLVAVLLPSLSQAREQSRRVVCGSNMHQHLIVVMMYAHDNKGKFPLNPSECLNSAGGSWWIDTVVATYDPGRYPFDLRLLLKRYCGGQNEMFSCPSNGGPSMNDQASLDYVAANGYMGAQIMMFWNSVCVFKGTQPQSGSTTEVPWAPKPEWRQGGLPDSVPLVQDEFTAIGSSVVDLSLFYYNHGYAAERSSLPGSPPYTNYKISGNRADCAGLNMGFLDNHVAWIRNTQSASGWKLDIPYSGSADRCGGSTSTSGAPVTLPRQIVQH